MTVPDEYTPPTSASIAERQDDPTALRLLLAQRRLYTRAKRWQGLRWIGLLVLGVAAPFVSVIFPPFAVIAGALTGAWLFLGRTVLGWAEVRTMTKAAAVQEQFDLYVFQMPTAIHRTVTPSLEDIAAIVGPDSRVDEIAEKEKLTGWYPVDTGDPGAVTVAIAQRANAAYTDRLIRTAVNVWAGVTIVWVLVLVGWSLSIGMAFATFLLGVLFPVLPAVLDIIDYLRNTRRASRDRKDLADTIEGRLRDRARPVEPQELLVWQDRMFDLRRTTPQVPDWLYRINRKRNEAAMRSAAHQLGEK